MRIDHPSPFALLFAAAWLSACGGDDPPSAGGEESPSAVESAGGVEYEPAFPDEVSAEGLSESDAAQQEVHTHEDGETHAHEDEDEPPPRGGNEGEDAHDGGDGLED